MDIRATIGKIQLLSIRKQKIFSQGRIISTFRTTGKFLPDLTCSLTECLRETRRDFIEFRTNIPLGGELFDAGSPSPQRQYRSRARWRI